MDGARDWGHMPSMINLPAYLQSAEALVSGSELNGDSLNALKRCFDSKMDLIKVLLGQKWKNFKFELV